MQPYLGDYTVRWAVVAGVGVLALAGLHAVGASLDAGSAWPSVLAVGRCLLVLAGFTAFRWAMPRFGPATAIPVDVTLSVLQVFVLVQAFLPLIYAAAALGAGFPTLDDTLGRLDRMLFGFEWDAMARWLAGRPGIEWVLSSAYFSLPLQAAALVVLGSIFRPGERNGEFVWIACTAMAMTTAVFVFTPALGMGGQVAGYVDALKEIRAGGWTVFDYARPEGIVVFPSFHATLALVFVYLAGRTHRWALAVFAPLNAVMLLSIPPIGGHYLIDVVGGGAVAAASIVLVRLARRRVRGAPALRVVAAG